MSGILFAKYTPSALRLAMAMGPADPDLFETDTSMIDKLLEQAKPGLKFNKLAEFGTVFHPADPVVQFEHHDYRTPSGKIELTGSAFIDAGLPRAPFAPAEARPGGGELRLLSPASKWLMNSSFGNDLVAEVVFVLEIDVLKV